MFEESEHASPSVHDAFMSMLGGHGGYNPGATGGGVGAGGVDCEAAGGGAFVPTSQKQPVQSHPLASRKEHE